MANGDVDLSKFPTNPDDQQVYVDKDGNQWKYDLQTTSWEFCGPELNVGLASETQTGFLSPEFKLLLDTVAQFPGAFGIVVDKPFKQTVEGDVKFISNSLDISCLSSRGVPLGQDAGCGEETTVSCSGSEDDISSLPRFEITLKEAYLEKLCIDLPAPKGPDGRTGPDGEKGEDGFGDGPKGATGTTGPDVTELFELGEIIYQDDPTVTNCPIVDLELVDRGRGPFFKITKSCRTLSPNECAERLIVDPIVRNVQFAAPVTNADCNLTGLQDWSITRTGADPLPDEPFLLRSTDDETEDCSTVSAVSLRQFVESLINSYEQQVVKLDEAWALQAKEHIEVLDDRARKILSGLADELARCESTLAGTEFGITFERCAPCSPAGPAALSLAENGNVGTIEASGKKWDIIS